MTQPSSAVTTVDAGQHQVSRRTVVDAPTAELFDMVADPHRHPEIDGSGTVRDQVDGPHRVELGSKFAVGMKQFGVPYKITSTVTKFEENKVVEWRHPMGHHWRWEFTEVAPDKTQVTETFDYRGAKIPKVLELLGQPSANGKGITNTLATLQKRYARA